MACRVSFHKMLIHSSTTNLIFAVFFGRPAQVLRAICWICIASPLTGVERRGWNESGRMNTWSQQQQQQQYVYVNIQQLSRTSAIYTRPNGGNDELHAGPSICPAVCLSVCALWQRFCWPEVSTAVYVYRSLQCYFRYVKLVNFNHLFCQESILNFQSTFADITRTFAVFDVRQSYCARTLLI